MWGVGVPSSSQAAPAIHLFLMPLQPQAGPRGAQGWAFCLPSASGRESCADHFAVVRSYDSACRCPSLTPGPGRTVETAVGLSSRPVKSHTRGAIIWGVRGRHVKQVTAPCLFHSLTSLRFLESKCIQYTFLKELQYPSQDLCF